MQRAVKQHSSRQSSVSRARRRDMVLHHYRRVMPDRKLHRVLLWGVFFFVAIVVAVQLLYPPSRTRPLTFINQTLVSAMDETTLSSQLTKRFEKSTLRVVVEGGTAKDYRLATAGAQLDADKASDELVNYPLWARFIPLTLLVPSWYRDGDGVYFNQQIAAEFATTVGRDLSYGAKNARLRIENGQLQAESEQSGQVVDTVRLVRQLTQRQVVLGGTTVVIAASSEQRAQTTADDLATVRTQAEQALEQAPVLRYGDHEVAPARSDVASWLLLGDEAGVTTLQLDDVAVHAYFAQLDQQYGTAPGVTNVTLRDGREVGRSEGAPGVAIDQAQMFPLLSERLLEQPSAEPLQLAMTDVPATIIYNNSYTASQDGLRAYVHDAAKKYSANIVVRQLDAPGWTAENSATLSTPSASTYKLFVAMRLFDDMNRGKVGWNDPMLDTTVSGCFDRMTIASTNPCATEWLSQWGRSNMNQYVYQRGFSTGTTFTSPTATHTTAADLTKFMVGLHDGSLVSGAQRDRLLRSLSVHPYRDGIPSGSAGRVYDKVGFLWDYVHDTAIVQHPRGTYVLTVMTKGQSYGRIAAITREIEKILYP